MGLFPLALKQLSDSLSLQVGESQSNPMFGMGEANTYRRDWISPFFLRLPFAAGALSAVCRESCGCLRVAALHELPPTAGSPEMKEGAAH